MTSSALQSWLLGFALALSLSLFLGCAPEEKSEEEVGALTLSSGDLVISNAGSRDVKVFSADGVYKGTLLDLDNASGQAPYGLEYNPLSQQILVAVDGAAGRVIKGIHRSSFAITDFSTSSALNNTLRGLALLTSGDLLVVIAGGNRVEKLNGLTGTQITAGAWPKSLQTAGTGVAARLSGSFVHCSSGTDAVRLYDATGAQTATVSSGIASTTDVMDCKADSTGHIYAVYNGTTDTVRKYDSTLGTTTWSYSNTVLLPNPTGLAVRSNGSALVLDQTLHHVLVVAADGTSATTLGSDSDNLLNSPQFILILP
ncbi:MAG: hypothetical protein ACK5Y2_01560 [Bdellovibrionales bacterium]